jgi:hypothetical protein
VSALDLAALRSCRGATGYAYAVVVGSAFHGRRVSLLANTRARVARHVSEAAALGKPVAYERYLDSWRPCRPARVAAPKLRVDLEPDAVFGWSWAVYRGDQAICSGITDDSNRKSVARREALAAAAVAEAPAEGSAA